ncbi:hypothetical protein Fmac_006473 [Flemingia macrophylla]|uniref:Uncharacterized protein n=1 Tax=Flemingia macrophylla TaxID=520843 RepID=A0ABD1NB67_9FABA
MKTSQSDSRVYEPQVAYPCEPTASTSTTCWNNFDSNIPNLPEQTKGNRCNSSRTAKKKRLIIVKRVYSTRTRGRSGALHSLAHKLGRFKVRTVIVQDIATEETNPKT